MTETTPTPDTTAETPAAETPSRSRILLVTLLAAVLVGGGAMYFHYRNRVSTDDAQVDGHLVPISCKVYGSVEQVLVDIATEDPVVMVFEDLQWADSGLLAFIDHLVEWSRGVPIYVDLGCPEGTLYLLNMNYLNLYVHDMANFSFSGFESLLSSSTLGYIGVVLSLLELVCTKPSTQAVVTGFTSVAL